ncbi:MAG TPA: glycine oxidase ThiO [Candidatus Acidoferrales bacterium]|nr:glycine oxidase ThiO [Candidatus Acidoferrales bacterium]
MMQRYDTIIVGGGIIGASLAFELARAKQSVLLLDRQEPGREASWAAAGTISPAPDPESLGIVPLGLESFRLYPEFIAAIEQASRMPAGFHANGAMELFLEPQGEAERDVRLHELSSFGIRAEALSLDEARRREPGLGLAVRSALWILDEANLDPRVVTEVTLAAAANTGVEIRGDLEVRAVVTEHAHCKGVLAVHAKQVPSDPRRQVQVSEKIGARNVVIAAGWRCAEIAGVESFAPTLPVRGQMVALGPVPGAPRTILRCELGYMVPRERGRVVVGSTLEPGAIQKHPTPAGLRKLLHAATEMIPALAEAPILEMWAGLRPDSPDHLPIIGPTDVKGLFIATGHYRNGMLLAPATAKYLSEWIVQGKTSDYFAPFSPLRYVQSCNATQGAAHSR